MTSEMGLAPYSPRIPLSRETILGQMVPRANRELAHSRRGNPREVGLSLKALFNKFHIIGEAGAGKSRYMGRELAWLLLKIGWPHVILDPTGGTIDNLLDRIVRLRSRGDRVKCFERITYVDMSATWDFVVPFPLYSPLTPEDSLFDRGQRIIEVFRRVDSDLSKAPIMGLNALVTIGTHTGMVLASLDYQITEAPNLILHTEEWDGRLEKALSVDPDVLPSVEFFRSFAKLKPNERDQQSRAFLTKLIPLTTEPKTRATVAASKPGLDWQGVVNRRQTVLLDLSGVRNEERRRFLMLWCLRSIMEFAQLRGFAGRLQPLGLTIDEYTEVLGFGSRAENAVMAEDTEKLISVYARNYGVAPLCIAHQNLPQLNSERIQKAVMTMDTQMIGVQTDPESSQLLSQYFYRYDPYMVKRYEPVWMSGMFGAVNLVDYRPIDFTLEEQEVLNKYNFMDLGQFEFVLRPSLGEGDKRGKVRRITIANLDPGLYPRVEVLAEVKKHLMRRDGRPVRDVLQEIEARRHIEISAPQVEPSSEPGSFSFVPQSEVIEIGTPDPVGD